MNRSEYQSLLKKLANVRDEAIAVAEEEFGQAVEALDQLWEIAGSGESKRGPGRPRKKTSRRRKTTRKKRATSTGRKKKTTRRGRKKKSTTRRGRRGRAGGTVISAMRGAISKQRGSFTVGDVKTNMPNTMVKGTKPAVFSTTMKRLEDLGEIKVVKRGKGRRATTYKKAA